MRIHCRVVVIAVCFGVFLLLYFLGGNGGADEPLLKEVGGDRELEEDGRSPPSLSDYLGSDAVAKLARKSSAVVGERGGRKERKATGRRGSVNAKRESLIRLSVSPKIGMSPSLSAI
ncbi:hypothetical protein ATANTOWER_029313 [Ataeniobius toweri]|uniref:Uncharacterized protein n=1 Tax=Ataeniobius toweri TaxID=208326 RepID=A0ABU7BYG8_9TELE|nr:hypothetical protein [Ataeniobius toweri]